MKKLLNIILVLFLIILNCSICVNRSEAAYISNSMINDKWFYIKNAYSGKYLDVYKGVAANGTNVVQYEFNGSNNQKWFIHNVGDGKYQICSMVGSTVSDGTRYLNYALDVSGGNDGSDEVNIQLWGSNNSNAQKFEIGLSAKENNTVAILTTPSNYKSSITVKQKSCANDANIFQYNYNGSCNDEWILEPVNENRALGIEYAKANYDKFVQAYPNCNIMNGDCANFVSQCLLAGGQQHYTGNWKVYRKNGTYSTPTNVSQLDETWELCAPNTSPWISAKEFR